MVKPLIYSLVLLIILSVTSQFWGPYYAKTIGSAAIAIGSENITGKFNDDLLEYTIEPDDPVKQLKQLQEMSEEKIKELGLPVSRTPEEPINYNNEIEIRSAAIWLILYITLIPIIPTLGMKIDIRKYIALGISCIIINIFFLVLIFASLEIVVANPSNLSTWNNTVKPLIPLLNIIPCGLLIGYIVVMVKNKTNKDSIWQTS